MINSNEICISPLLCVLYAKKEKNLIHINKLRNKIEITSNNSFLILMIFKNNVINI